ncbi:MAG: LacI family DNA-binding transcriptional regulator [Chloroflexi bacterium]|uniref:LacI family DNA-binding transcriptional regulator n=1 Tax=Candidatus Flexifilum breve TaxID=3140694 RepID=UPI003135563F|nr:LacI family DNA-binding transcriptional regulator [Chloroflexota bacterium]
MNSGNLDVKKKPRVTITDVARAAGLSVATVSRVLSGYEFVKESTRTRVMEAVEQLGYVASLPARSLAGGRSRTIGVLVPNLDVGYVGTVTQGIDQALSKANCDLVLYTSHHQATKEIYHVSAIANGITEGLLLVAPQFTSAYLDMLRERGFPYVLIDQTDANNNSDVVESTNYQGAYEATRHLCQLGHTRIAFIVGELSVWSAVERLRGYKAALADHQIPLVPELILQGDYQQQTGYEVTKQVLNNVNPPPTAIFACNDISAFGAMDAAREHGLRIPDDISIIGFDDIPQASLVYPKLTTVRQPLQQMGQVAAEMLVERIMDPSRLPRRVTLATQLVIRDSCAPPQLQVSNSQESFPETGGSLAPTN